MICPKCHAKIHLKQHSIHYCSSCNTIILEQDGKIIPHPGLFLRSINNSYSRAAMEPRVIRFSNSM